MSLKSLTPEHLAKIQAGRAKWQAKKVEERKALRALIPEKKPLEGTIYEMAENQNKEAEVDVVDRIPKTVINSRERVIHKVNKKLDKLIDAQVDLATGLYYVTTDGKHVYTKPPNGSTGEYLLNQLIGKPKENIEIKNTNLNLDL